MKLFTSNTNINNISKTEVEVLEKVFDDLIANNKEFSDKFDLLKKYIEEYEDICNKIFNLKQELQGIFDKNVNKELK